jgi:phosphatidylglycerol:prolipoprotein diacylglycerol transferase
VHPVLIDLGRFQLRSYGLMMFIAFVVGIWIAHRRGVKRGLGENTIIDFSTAIIISGLVGSRTLYVLTHLSEYRGHMWDIISPVQSDGTIGYAGLVLLGGVILAFITVVLFARIRKVNLLTILDVFAPSLAIGIALGRIGCYFNGCCFGTPTDLPWGVVFPQGSLAGYIYPGIHIHPTQLYATLYNTALFFGLLWAEERFRTFPGFTWSLFMIGYGILRFANELLRFQESGLRLIRWNSGFITVSQTVSIVMVLAGVALFVATRRKYLLPAAGNQKGSDS